MTEQKWLTCTDPTPMLEFLRDKASERKLRLFACACCFCLPRQYQHEAFSRMTRTVGDFADGLVKLPKMNKLRSVKLFRMLRGEPCDTIERVKNLLLSGKSSLWSSAVELSTIVARLQGVPVVPLIIDLFGNPFRPVSVDPFWLTSDVRTLAEGIYQDRAFDRMPILADALQDAGCNNENVLAHCRSEGPHVKGCWVVDLLTGRK